MSAQKPKPEAKKKLGGCGLYVLVLGGALLAVVVFAAIGGSDDAGSRQPDDASSRQQEKVMYFCGIDRSRDSDAYGELLFSTGINVWEKAGDNRGSVVRQARHLERVVVIEERRVFDGPGGLHYRLEGGGWTSDLWLTDEKCTATNLAQFDY